MKLIKNNLNLKNLQRDDDTQPREQGKEADPASAADPILARQKTRGTDASDDTKRPILLGPRMLADAHYLLQTHVDCALALARHNDIYKTRLQIEK